MKSNTTLYREILAVMGIALQDPCFWPEARLANACMSSWFVNLASLIHRRAWNVFLWADNGRRLNTNGGEGSHRKKRQDSVLAAYRQQIDPLDQRIVNLIQERARVVEQVGELKRETHLPVYIFEIQLLLDDLFFIGVDFYFADVIGIVRERRNFQSLHQ